MRMQKKGALELTLNTIVIIVIAVVLLTLSIVFVRDLFTKITGTSSQVFQSVDIEIGKLQEGDTKMSVPSVVNVKQGESKIFDIVIANDGLVTSNLFTLNIQPNYPTNCGQTQCATATNLPIKIISTGVTNNGKTISHTISPGDRPVKFQVQVIADSSAPPTIGLNQPTIGITVKAGTQTYEQAAVMVKVEKGKGLFG